MKKLITNETDPRTTPEHRISELALPLQNIPIMLKMGCGTTSGGIPKAPKRPRKYGMMRLLDDQSSIPRPRLYEVNGGKLKSQSLRLYPKILMIGTTIRFPNAQIAPPSKPTASKGAIHNGVTCLPSGNPRYRKSPLQ